MKFYSTNQITEAERQSILSKHREPYNGYQTLNPKIENNQPLYVQDFALDKQGLTLNNKGNIKPYTNINIHEGHSMDQCNECGGSMYEGECSECGWKMEETNERFDGEKMKKIGRNLKSVGAAMIGIPSYDHTDETGKWKKDKEGKDYDMFRYAQRQGADELEDEMNAAKKQGLKKFNLHGKTYDVDGGSDTEEMTEEKNMCSECGGSMYEGECSECGWKMEEVNEESSFSEKFKNFIGRRTKRTPYTADAVQKILKQIYSSKTEQQLLSAMKMYENLLDTNEDFNEAYKERIMTAYRRKADELDFYMRKKDLKQALTEFETGKLDDIYSVSDLDDNSEFDYVEGDDNYQGSFEQQHKMKKLKSESATSNTPLSYGKHYKSIEEPYNFKSNGPVGDGGTLRQKNVNETDNMIFPPAEATEQTVGGGNAPDFDVDWEDPAFDFVSKGPKEDTYTEPADDMDLDDVKKPYDFISGGSEDGGDVYPVNENDECDECWEKMESAWSDDAELDEVDISGVQGMYGDMEPAFNFVSTGAGKGGPYQTSDFPQGYEGEDEDAYWELEAGELNPDKIDRDASWEEITASTGEDELSHLDESLLEKFKVQKDKVNEMILRMKNFN